MKQDSKIRNNETENQRDEISLIALIKTLWEGRQKIIATVIIFILIGLFVALFSEKEYTVTTTMVPQMNSTSAKIGGLSSLASLAGFNLDIGSGGGELSPKLYPQIVSSISFQLEIMNAKYSFEDIEEELTLFEYYMDYYKPGLFSLVKKYTIGLPWVILNAIREKSEEISMEIGEDDIIVISMDQFEISELLDEKLTLEVNEMEGYISLHSKFHEAKLSAEIAKKAQHLLQETITKFKIEKANAQRDFINERYLETKQQFIQSQTALAAFRDANKNITSAIALTELEKLENEFQLAFEVYSELAKQLEQARITVKEDTPVFSVIKEVVVPVERSKPKRMILMILFTFLGGIVGIMLAFTRHYYKSIKSQWKQIDALSN